MTEIKDKIDAFHAAVDFIALHKGMEITPQPPKTVCNYCLGAGTIDAGDQGDVYRCDPCKGTERA